MVTIKTEETAIPRRSTREAILGAANAVIAEMGARHLTLDAVAREAGVSKGGLLYHFPSKEALLAAMVESFCDKLSAAAPVEEGGKRDSLGLLRDLIGYRILAHAQKREDIRAAHGMIAAVAERPSLLDPLTAYYRKLWACVRQGPEPERAMVSWLALEGLFFLEIFNTSPFEDAERKKIIDLIQSLLGEAAGEVKSAGAKR